MENNTNEGMSDHKSMEREAEPFPSNSYPDNFNRSGISHPPYFSAGPQPFPFFHFPPGGMSPTIQDLDNFGVGKWMVTDPGVIECGKYKIYWDSKEMFTVMYNGTVILEITNLPHAMHYILNHKKLSNIFGYGK